MQTRRAQANRKWRRQSGGRQRRAAAYKALPSGPATLSRWRRPRPPHPTWPHARPPRAAPPERPPRAAKPPSGPSAWLTGLWLAGLGLARVSRTGPSGWTEGLKKGSTSRIPMIAQVKFGGVKRRWSQTGEALPAPPLDSRVGLPGGWLAGCLHGFSARVLPELSDIKHVR